MLPDEGVFDRLDEVEFQALVGGPKTVGLRQDGDGASGLQFAENPVANDAGPTSRIFPGRRPALTRGRATRRNA